MIKNLLTGAACALLLLTAGPACSAPADATALLREMQTAYAAMPGFRASFTQKLTHQEGGVTETRKGTLLFRRPLLVRWETTDPAPELLLVTDKDIWNYLPDEELAYRYALSIAQDSHSVIQVVTGQAPLDRDFDVEAAPASAGGQPDGLVHLLLYPHEPNTQLTEAQIWIDPKTAFIRRVQLMDFAGNLNDITLETLTPASSFASEDFTFAPPPGTDVEDHRNDGQNAEPKP